ncbi:hypothetical protein IMY05_C4392000500 [Salix suchowensis]|nr:hypothetical protein IMY05_C4392000500 [Salix suchowensis]
MSWLILFTWQDVFYFPSVRGYGPASFTSSATTIWYIGGSRICVSRQAPSGPSLPGTRAPTRAEMLYASYKKAATVDEKEDLPRSPSAASSTTAPSPIPPTSYDLTDRIDPSRAPAKQGEGTLEPIVPTITLQFASGASAYIGAKAFDFKRLRGGQPSLHRGQSYSGPPIQHPTTTLSFGDGIPPSKAEARSIHSVASPPISRHSNASASAAYPHILRRLLKARLRCPFCLASNQPSVLSVLVADVSVAVFVTPMSPHLKPCQRCPVQGMYQPVSPPLQVPVVTQPPATGPRSSTLLQDTGKAAAATVGSTLGRIALRVALGSVGDVIGDAIGSVASEAISSIGADAATSAFTDSSVVDGLAAGLTAGAGFMDPSSFLTAGMLGGDMTSAVSGDAMSGLTESFAGLSTTEPAAYGGYSTDAFQNYQTIMESIQANQPSYADTYSQILQAQQAQQNAAQSQFESIYQSQLQSQQDLMQQIMQQAQTTQAEAYKTQMEMYQNILEQSQSTSSHSINKISPLRSINHRLSTNHPHNINTNLNKATTLNHRITIHMLIHTKPESVTPNVSQHPQPRAPTAHHSATSPYPSSYRPPQMVHPPGRR